MILYLLLCELCSLGRGLLPGTRGGVFVPFVPLPLVTSAGRLPVERLEVFCEEGVVGEEDLSNHELRVEEDLLRFCEGSVVTSTSPSLLELPEEGLLSVFLNEAAERRRRVRSLRNEGICCCYCSG